MNNGIFAQNHKSIYSGYGHIWIVDNVNWWSIGDYIPSVGKENMDSRFRESVDSTLYLDYIGIFNREEFAMLNDGYKASFLVKTIMVLGMMNNKNA